MTTLNYSAVRTNGEVIDNTVNYIDLQYANFLVAIKLQIQSTNLFCKDGMVKISSLINYNLILQ